MARNRETKIELTAYDDLFQTDESRAEAALSKIRDIPLSEIDEFPDHPFKVLMDEDMEQLVESVKRNGVMTPATVRLKEDGRYELISGHRRKKACELAGLETLKCEVKDLTRDEAIIIMVESNLQRSVILPSEKAFAYKMRLEAMKRQGQRSDLTSSPLATKLQSGRSDTELGELVGESKDQIRRFIRLTELVPEILQMVDEKQIAFRPAVEISYLAEEQQYTLLEAMSYNDATPSLAQAMMRKSMFAALLVLIMLLCGCSDVSTAPTLNDESELVTETEATAEAESTKSIYSSESNESKAPETSAALETAAKVTECEPVQSETVRQTEPAKQSEAETPATKSTTENNNPPPTETPTQTASENTKTAYDFEFDMEAIKADCISIGQSMGLRLDTSLTPSNASWWNPVTASRSNQGEILKQSLESYIKFHTAENLSAYGIDEISEFNICCEAKGNGEYLIYFLFA